MTMTAKMWGIVSLENVRRGFDYTSSSTNLTCLSTTSKHHATPSSVAAAQIDISSFQKYANVKSKTECQLLSLMMIYIRNICITVSSSYYELDINSPNGPAPHNIPPNEKYSMATAIYSKIGIPNIIDTKYKDVLNHIDTTNGGY